MRTISVLRAELSQAIKFAVSQGSQIFAKEALKIIKNCPSIVHDRIGDVGNIYGTPLQVLVAHNNCTNNFSIYTDIISSALVKARADFQEVRDENGLNILQYALRNSLARTVVSILLRQEFSVDDFLRALEECQKSHYGWSFRFIDDFKKQMNKQGYAAFEIQKLILLENLNVFIKAIENVQGTVSVMQQKYYDQFVSDFKEYLLQYAVKKDTQENAVFETDAIISDNLSQEKDVNQQLAGVIEDSNCECVCWCFIQ